MGDVWNCVFCLTYLLKSMQVHRGRITVELHSETMGTDNTSTKVQPRSRKRCRNPDSWKKTREEKGTEAKYTSDLCQ